MPKIFGQEATQKDFDLLMQQLRSGTAEADRISLCAGRIGEEIAKVEQAGEISESDFLHIADQSGGIIEDSPDRLTIPEIRYFRSQVTRFSDLVSVLERYGYSESAIFTSLVQANPSRIEFFEKVIQQPNFRLVDLPQDLRNDKHFIIALIQHNDEIYNQLLPQERLDLDFALQHVRSRVFEAGAFGRQVRDHDLFEFIPNSLRFDPQFLARCKEVIVRNYGHVIIDPSNFDYFWWTQDSYFRRQPQDPTLLPDQLKKFQFWVDFYDGDMESAFEVAIKGNMIPMEALKTIYLTLPDAARFYHQLPEQLKTNEELTRIAIANDPETALYLPNNSPLLNEAETWIGLLKNPDKRYYSVSRPDFPVSLLGNTKLINRIVATHPELLDNFSNQPDVLKRILSQLTIDNKVIFVSYYSEAFDLLPDSLQKDIVFARKLVEHDSRSQAAEKVFRIHGASFTVDRIRHNPEVILHIPEDILILPAVGATILEQMRLSKEETMPYWAKEYFERHTDQLASLVRIKPNWFSDLLHCTDDALQDAVLQLVKKDFTSLITTPERMESYVLVLSGTGISIDDLKKILVSYQGEVTREVSMAVESAVFRVAGGRYENPHPRYSDNVISLLINKYHILPSGITDETAAAHLRYDNADALMSLLNNSRHDLSNDCIVKIYEAIKSNPECIYEVAKIDPRILKAMSETEWATLGPRLIKLIDGDLEALALLYPLMPSSIRQDRNLALRATVADSNNYFYIPKTLLQDERFVIELCGWATVPAFDLQKMSRSAQIMSVSRFPFQFHLIKPQLRRDQDFIQACLAQNMWLFNELTEAEQAQAWPNFKRQLLQKGFTHEEVGSWKDFVDILKTRSVFPKRIRSIDGWKAAFPELFSFMSKPVTRDTHRVLILVSREDWNGAFASVPLVDRLVALGIHEIDYREVSSETDVKKVIAEAKKQGIIYDEVFVAGHGTQDSLALGGQDRARTGQTIQDDMYIDYSDFEAGDFDFASILKAGGRLIDLSCSNGQGAEKEDNLANRFATTLYPDQIVVASQVPTNIVYMDRDASGHIQVYWMGNIPYLVRGTKTL